MTARLIQLADDGLAKDPNQVILAGDAVHDAHKGSFLMGTDSINPDRLYFGQIVECQSNVNRDALGRFDPVSLNRMSELLKGKGSRDALIRDIHIYVVRLHGMRQSDDLSSVTVRPNIGTTYRPATADEVRRFVGLPSGEGAIPIGHLMNSDIPLCLTRGILKTHILVAGSTGSGKTHTCAQIVNAANELGACVIILDPKPDYQFIDSPDEGGRHLEDVLFFSLSEAGRVRSEHEEDLISVQTSDLDAKMLAGAVYHLPSDITHLANIAYLLELFREKKEGEDGWTWGQFCSWAKTVVSIPETWGGEKLNVNTKDALMRRLTPRQYPIPKWVDRVIPYQRGSGKTHASVLGYVDDSLGGGRCESFALKSLVEPGRVIVIRVPPSESGSREYALLLDYLRREAYELRPENMTPVLFLADEAADLFRGTSTFVDTVKRVLDDAIRKGRSQNIGFVLAVQNAGVLPPEILNNLLTQFLGRHQNIDGVSKACGGVFDKELLSLLYTLAPGEFLVSINGTKAPVQAKINRSPFKLHVIPD